MKELQAHWNYGNQILVVMQQIQLCKILYRMQNITKKSADYAIWPDLIFFFADLSTNENVIRLNDCKYN